MRSIWTRIVADERTHETAWAIQWKPGMFEHPTRIGGVFKDGPTYHLRMSERAYMPINEGDWILRYIETGSLHVLSDAVFTMCYTLLRPDTVKPFVDLEGHPVTVVRHNENSYDIAVNSETTYHDDRFAFVASYRRAVRTPGERLVMHQRMIQFIKGYDCDHDATEHADESLLAAGLMIAGHAETKDTVFPSCVQVNVKPKHSKWIDQIALESEDDIEKLAVAAALFIAEIDRRLLKRVKESHDLPTDGRHTGTTGE